MIKIRIKMKEKISLSDICCFLLDMDGTFYLGSKLLPGALEFMDYIHEKEKDYLFLTNNSSKHADFYAEKIHKMGFSVPAEKILTSGEATAIYLRKKMPDAKIFLVGTPTLEEEFRKIGIQLVTDKPDAVILGFDTTITYRKIWDICNFVREGLPYIATHPDFNCPTEKGFMPDIGSFIAMIKASTGRNPDVIVGKPYEHIIHSVIEKTGYNLDQIAMIGDRLYTDIALGDAGITTVLVLSGETNRTDLIKSEFQPDFIYDSLLDLVEDIKEKSG